VFFRNLLGRYPVSFVPEERFLSKEMYSALGIGPGSDAFLVGRFVNSEGKQQNTPCLRFGNVALEPGNDPIEHPNGYRQESFLVEVHSIGGFSGSPVFVILHPHDWQLLDSSLKRLHHVNGPWLLGVDWGHMDDWYPVKLEDRRTKHKDAIGVTHNTGMAYVVPAWKLSDLLHSEELKMQRKKIVDQHENEIANSGVVLDAAEDHTFSKEDFEDALKKVSKRLQPSQSDEGKSKT
jgi:hypothetical protein